MPAPIKIFYIDDEPELCDIFSEQFSSAEVQVITFTAPQIATAEARKNPPDIIFIDYRLPGTTGDIVAQLLPANIPIYLITGEISVATVFKFAAVLSKPLEMGKLLDIICGHPAARKTA